jgi:hypothetical protein
MPSAAKALEAIIVIATRAAPITRMSFSGRKSKSDGDYGAAILKKFLGKRVFAAKKCPKTGLYAPKG